MVYDIDYFIEKFKAIPDKEWTTGTFTRKHYEHCAMGHCGVDWQKRTNEGDALANIFLTKIKNCTAVANVNDGKNILFQQETPKARILAALEWLKCSN